MSRSDHPGNPGAVTCYGFPAGKVANRKPEMPVSSRTLERGLGGGSVRKGRAVQVERAEFESPRRAVVLDV